MNTYDKLQAEKKKCTHWLHIILLILTMGFWLPIYLIVYAGVKRHNAMIDIKMMGALAAQRDYQS